MEVELHLRPMACNPDMQQGQIEDIAVSLDENPYRDYVDYKKLADWEITLVVHRLSPEDIQ